MVGILINSDSELKNNKPRSAIFIY